MEWLAVAFAQVYIVGRPAAAFNFWAFWAFWDFSAAFVAFGSQNVGSNPTKVDDAVTLTIDKFFVVPGVSAHK